MTHTPTARTSSRDCPRTRPAALTSYCRTAGNPPTPDHQPLWTCVCRTLTDTFAEAKDELTQQHLFDGALIRHAQTEIGFNGQSPAFLFRPEEHKSAILSLMCIAYHVLCLTK